MSEIQLNLPEHLKQFVESETERLGCGESSDYIRLLIVNDLKAKQEDRLENELLQGIASGPGKEMTDTDWQALRNRVLNSGA